MPNDGIEDRVLLELASLQDLFQRMYYQCIELKLNAAANVYAISANRLSDEIQKRILP